MRGKIIVFFVLEESIAHEYAKGFYASEAWHKCRLGYISHRRSVDGGLCEECHENLGYIVHHREHITPRTVNDPRVTLSWDNLEYVCKDCHDKIHDYCGRSHDGHDRKIVFDEFGNPVVDNSPYSVDK